MSEQSRRGEVTSVTFAGASMRFRADGGRFVDCENDIDVLNHRNADVFMYRHDLRSVQVYVFVEVPGYPDSEPNVNVMDVHGHEFSIIIGDDDPYDVMAAIGAWRMAASEQWESERHCAS